ncbi:hypothetical protein MRX96_015771 [Rhipicephalus microplus]
MKQFFVEFHDLKRYVHESLDKETKRRRKQNQPRSQESDAKKVLGCWSIDGNEWLSERQLHMWHLTGCPTSMTQHLKCLHLIGPERPRNAVEIAAEFEDLSVEILDVIAGVTALVQIYYAYIVQYAPHNQNTFAVLERFCGLKCA